GGSAARRIVTPGRGSFVVPGSGGRPRMKHQGGRACTTHLSTGPRARCSHAPPAFPRGSPAAIRARITHPQPRGRTMTDEPDLLSDLDQLRSRYHVLRRLGHDGGAPVYAVRGQDSDRHYLVKVMAKP